MTFLNFRSWFDTRFSCLVQDKIENFVLHSQSKEVGDIVSYIKLLSENGKRFRPYLVYTASGLDEEGANKHFLLLASVELLHIFALIHDDIMDDADTRHGVSCAHKKFAKQYTPAVSEGIAILLGDIVFAWAYECLLAYAREFPNYSDRITEEFTKLVSEVTHGQLLEILSRAQSPRDKNALIEKMKLKTARYSFVQPMRLGFIVKGDHPDDHAFAEAFGIPLGIGFQLQDDLLDSVPGDQTGKTRFTDIQSGQQTLLSWYMHHHATPEDRREFTTFFGKREPFSDTEESRILELLETSGAIAHVREESRHYFTQARNAIDIRNRDDASLWGNILSLVHERIK